MADGRRDNGGARESSAEHLARLAATDDGGRVDETVYRLQKMVLERRRFGGIDAAGLVDDMVATPGFVHGRRKSLALIETIESRLDPIQARQFERALDAANLTDTGFERAAEETGGFFSRLFKGVTQAVHWLDERIGDGLKKVHDWAEKTAADRDANPLLRAAAGVVEIPVEAAQVAYGVVKAPVMKVTGAIEDVGDVGTFAARFATHPHYRDALFAMAKLELAESSADLARTAGDALVRAATDLDRMREEFRAARADGREAEYLGQLTGIQGFDTVSRFIGLGALDKLHTVAQTLDSISLDDDPEVSAALAHASRAIAAGGAAGDAGGDVWRAIVREYRDEGDLSALVALARGDGNLDTLLTLGELSPRELGDLLRTSPAVFASGTQPGVTFDAALDASLAARDPSKMDAAQAGEVAEAILTRDLLRAGYGEIAGMQRHDGRELAMAARNADGAIETFTVDAAALAAAAHTMSRDGVPGLAAQFEALVAGDPRLAARDSTPEARTVAAPTIPAPVAVPAAPDSRATAQAGNPYAVLAHPGLALDDTAHHDHPLFAAAAKGVQALDTQAGRAHDVRSDQLSAALAVAARRSGLASIDHVVLSDDGSRVFAVEGDLKSPLHKLAYVETVAAMNITIAESTAAMTRVEAPNAVSAPVATPQVEPSLDPARRPVAAA